MADVDEGEIIDQLYALATNPEEYEEFMLWLSDKIESLDNRPSDNTSGRKFNLNNHLKRAAALVDIVSPWRNDTDPELHSMLKQRMQATMAIDSDGIIVDSNDAAKVLYDLTPGATVGSLPLDSDSGEVVLRHIQNVTKNNTPRNSPNNVLRLSKADDGQALLITIEPHVSNVSNQTFAILRTNEIGWPSYLNTILQDLFDITRAEIDVLRLIVEGKRPAEIAERRRASIATVRSQLRSIYTKTNTRNQMDCARLVFGLSLMHDRDEGQRIAARIQSAQNIPLFPRDDQHHLFHLPNGRQIDYSVFGAEDGEPLLFYHCQTWGDVWFAEAVDEASAAGFKIIAPLRPGFGKTTVYDGSFSDPRLFALDLDRLLDHLGVNRTPIISVGTGLVHALASASLSPTRVASIIAAHPSLPVQSREDYEGLHGFNKLIARSRLHFPQALGFLVKSGFAYVSKSGPEAFARSLLRDAPKDVEWVTRPDILPITVHGLNTHAQGHLGCLGDIAYCEDWSDLLVNCRAPIRFVIGEHDRNIQWRSVHRFVETLDHVSMEIMHDSGYLVHHQHSTQILNWAKADMARHCNAL